MTSFVSASVSTLVCFWVMLFVAVSAQAKVYKEIEWVSLIPKAELDILLNPPESIMGISDGVNHNGLADSLANSIEDAISASTKVPTPEEQIYYAALESTNVNSEFSNKNIRLPGFIVPLEYDDNQVITEFFLVPYFGACIHLPPPPPNQIIHVKYPKGITLEALYDPFWVEGSLLTEVVENDLATSAYSLNADAVKPYES